MDCNAYFLLKVCGGGGAQLVVCLIADQVVVSLIPVQPHFLSWREI